MRENLLKKYLLQVKEHEGEYSDIKSVSEIIDAIDELSDKDALVKVFDISFGNVKELKIHGPWHDAGNPLYIKVVDEENKLIFDGYVKER